jgi:hypothetical protein
MQTKRSNRRNTMEQTTKERSIKRKKNTIAIALVLVMLLSGTYTWSAISQKALNETYDLVNPGGRLHDDYDGNNKDVYVENFGEAPIFVRVRLDEYLDVEDVPITTKNSSTTKPPKRDDVTTWTTYNPYVTDKKDNVSNTYFDLHFGGQKWYMPTFNKSNGNLRPDQPNPRIAFLTSTGDLDDTSNQIPWNGAENDKKDMPSNTDAESGAYQAGIAALTSPNDRQEALEDFWTPSDPTNPDTKVAKEWIWDKVNSETIIDTADSTHTATQTRTANVISMAEWKASKMQLGDFWVYDTDGWAYWASRVWPGEATGLLLDGITQSIYFDPQGDWYYAVNVVGQFATADDYATAFDDTDASNTAKEASGDALDLLELVENGYEPGKTFVADTSKNITWRVLAKDAAGNMLIITDKYITGSAITYNATDAIANYATATTLNIKTQMDTWYTANAGNLVLRDLKWEPVNLPVERTVAGPWPNPINSWSGAWQKSLSTAGSKDADDFTSVVFPLSISEFYAYGNIAASPGTNTLGTADNVYWLRSPGNSTTGSYGPSASTSVPVTIAANSASCYMRPALWIRPY